MELITSVLTIFASGLLVYLVGKFAGEIWLRKNIEQYRRVGWPRKKK